MDEMLQHFYDISRGFQALNSKSPCLQCSAKGMCVNDRKLLMPTTEPPHAYVLQEASMRPVNRSISKATSTLDTLVNLL